MQHITKDTTMNTQDIQYKNGRYIYTPPCGMMTEQAIQNANDLVQKLGCTVFVHMNDIILCMNKNTDIQKMHRLFCDEINRKKIDSHQRILILRLATSKSAVNQNTIG